MKYRCIYVPLTKRLSCLHIAIRQRGIINRIDRYFPYIVLKRSRIEMKEKVIKMEYQIIALDVDGTLTNSEKNITSRTRRALIEAQLQGKKVIVASGRHQFGLKDIASELQLDRFGGYVMAFNGGRVIDASTGEVLSAKYFPREYIKPVCDTVKDANITVISYEGDTIVMNDKVNDYSFIESKILGMDYKQVPDLSEYITFDVNKLLLAGEPSVLDEYEKILVEKYKGYFDVFKSCPFFLEIMPFGVNKGACMPALLEKLGLTREQLIACGDSYNDMTMIVYAGLGVCMENGENDVKKISDVIADSNDNDGVAKIVEEYMLHRNAQIA